MSAIVEWWEPAAIQREVAIDFNSQVRSDGFETTLSPDQKPMTRVPKTVPRQSHLPSADYEYLASLGWDAFGALSLGIHKRSRRACAIKVISNAIVEEQTVFRAVLEEQRIMREASSFPFLLELMASFYDANGFYLVSVSFCSC
jgi:serine/threonine protein kinase